MGLLNKLWSIFSNSSTAKNSLTNHTLPAKQAKPKSQLTPSDLAHIEFAYSDAIGHRTRRDVIPSDIHSDGITVYIEAYCNKANDKRTFRLDRIQGDITLCNTGEIITHEELIDIVSIEAGEPLIAKLPDHLKFPSLETKCPLFIVIDDTDYLDLLTYDRTAKQIKQLTQKDIDNIDPEEIDLDILTFPESLRENALAGFKNYTPGLAHLLTDHHEAITSNPQNTGILKQLLTSDISKGLLDKGYLIEIPRTCAIDKTIISMMKVKELKPVAKKLGLRVTQSKEKLILNILDNIKPETTLPPLVMTNKNKLDAELQRLADEYSASAKALINTLPKNYQNALKEQIEEFAELPLFK